MKKKNHLNDRFSECKDSLVQLRDGHLWPIELCYFKF